jgi:hypothetical protein
LIVLGVWLGCPSRAWAHRLDEYLQASRLSIDLDRVGLEVDLTAGAGVAPQVFAWIDTNRDGRISPVEGESYANQVLASVALSVDGRPIPVTLIECHFPEFQEMSLGVGTIRVRAAATIPASTDDRRQLAYVNAHRPDESVYLVNALLPADPRIQIIDQRRDRTQHRLTLHYEVVSRVPWARATWLLTALAMVTVLGVTRRRYRSPRTWLMAEAHGRISILSHDPSGISHDCEARSQGWRDS